MGWSRAAGNGEERPQICTSIVGGGCLCGCCGPHLFPVLFSPILCPPSLLLLWAVSLLPGFEASHSANWGLPNRCCCFGKLSVGFIYSLAPLLLLQHVKSLTQDVLNHVSSLSHLPPSPISRLLLCRGRALCPSPGSCCAAGAMSAETSQGEVSPFSLWGSALSTPNWFFESIFFFSSLHLHSCSPALGEEPPRKGSLGLPPAPAQPRLSIPTEPSRTPAPAAPPPPPRDQPGPRRHVQGGGQRLPEQKFPQQRFPRQAEQVSAAPFPSGSHPGNLEGG